ncbi:MAG: glycosyltransferase family 4 protein, partial [Acidimicrobiales bacterium]
MKTIGVNLLWLQPGVVGGSEEYTLSLLRAVHEIDPLDLELRLYVQKSLLEHHPDLGQRFEVLTAPGLPGGKVGRVVAEHTWLARQSTSVSVVHHAGGVIPSQAPSVPVLTILDLQPLDMPENFGFIKRAWLGRMIPRSLERAAVIVTPSSFTAGRITAMGVSEDRLHVVPFGLEPSEDGLSSRTASDPVAPVAPVFVYPAIAYPHKRHADLIEAFSILVADHPEARLILTGGEGPLTGPVRSLIEAASLGGSVKMTGRISRPELLELVASATAVVIPSEYEGFGLPALEAMSLGTPVIVADAGSLPEVVGGAGIVVPPR